MRTRMSPSTMDRAIAVIGVATVAMWVILVVAGIALMVLVATT